MVYALMVDELTIGLVPRAKVREIVDRELAKPLGADSDPVAPMVDPEEWGLLPDQVDLLRDQEARLAEFTYGE